MGLRPGEFWEITQADFERMSAAYRKRQEMDMWTQRRIEAALWNVQIAKAGGTEINPQDLYPLSITDGAPQKPGRKNTKKPVTHSGRLSKEQYQALMAKRFPPTSLVAQTDPDGSNKHSD